MERLKDGLNNVPIYLHVPAYTYCNGRRHLSGLSGVYFGIMMVLDYIILLNSKKKKLKISLEARNQDTFRPKISYRFLCQSDSDGLWTCALRNNIMII